jgi:cytochrome c-type biogenesis protein CcmE
VVEAYYTGVVPDTFKGEAEVVMSGKLDSDSFHAKA